MSRDVKVWRYSIPSEAPYGGWAIILMDSTGFFAVVSDYGNYAYKWNAFGGPEVDFREWFVVRSQGYVEDKLAQGAREFDGDKTLINVKDHIIQLRRDNELTKDEARQEWDEISDSYGDFGSEDDWNQWLEATSLSDMWELASYGIPGQILLFCKEVLPKLDELIKAELRKERGLEPVRHQSAD